MQPIDAVTSWINVGANVASKAATAWYASTTAALADVSGRGRGDDPLAERDPEYIRRTLPAYQALSNAYHRADVRGLENIPADEPVLLVGNHSGGTLIVDTFIFSYAFYRQFGPDRRFHALTHDLAIKLPGVAALIRKYGAIPARRDLAERALQEGAAVLVYPGGDHESYRPSWESAKVDFDHRMGFARLAIDNDVPIVPVAAMGGQETAFFAMRGQGLAKSLGLHKLRLKVFPVQIGPPFGVTLLDMPFRFPLPAQVTVQVLPPIRLREQFGDHPDPEAVYDAVTGQLQEAVTALAEERDLPVVGPLPEPVRDVGEAVGVVR